MSPTIIHSHDGILQYAGREGFSTQAVLGHLQKPVLITARSFVQEEIDALANVLRTTNRDMWLRTSKQSFIPTPGPYDDATPIPSIYLSNGLVKDKDSRPVGAVQTVRISAQPDMAYIIVVRGRSAALCSKVRLFYSLSAAGIGILEEACNGYLTAFSAALLKSDVSRLTDSRLHLTKVDSLMKLYAYAGVPPKEDTIPLYC